MWVQGCPRIQRWTHHASQAEAEEWIGEGPGGLCANWQGPTFWSHGTVRSRGVAVLSSRAAAARISDLEVQHCSTDGRILGVDFHLEQTPFTVVSVYAPHTAASRPAFYRHQLLPSLPQDRRLVLGGDWNCISSELDLLDPAGNPAHRYPGYWDGLREVEAARQLHDVWRERNGTARTFTHVSSSGTSARLDRWMVSEQLLAWVSPGPHAAGQTVGYPGDHLGVTLSLTIPGSLVPGQGAWRLSLHLLDDQQLCNTITTRLPEFAAAHPISHTYSHGQRWEDIKQLIRDLATQRSYQLALQRRQATRDLEADSRTAQAAYAAAPTNAAALTAWREAHYLLQELNAAAAHAAANQAGLAWQQYGEQSTYWFHHVARERQAQTAIAALRSGVAPDSPVLELRSADDREEGLRILEEFYSGASPSGLFSARPVSLAAQDSLLAAIDQQLTPETAAAGEGDLGDGSLTLGELASALKGLPRGKAPGRDGIPYEFYRRFWDQVGDHLLAALQQAFTADSPALPHSTLHGRITLLYKGKGADRAAPASYRPITLLNTDYKLAARAIASRMGPLLSQVVDATQTAFLPDRWIGDNVLAHLEEIAYLERTQQPGIMLFLDFEKAFDRLDRHWIERCMAAVGFGPGLQRWVRLLHSGTTASVAMNGWHTQSFPVSSGVFQGSPLSPLLYALACQPLAAHVRQRAREGAFQQIRLPSGRPAPAIQQHADDTSIHVPSPEDARVVLDGSVELHCQATSAKLQRAKSQGLAVGSAAPIEGVEPVTGITFSVDAAGITHLGIPLSRDEGAAQQALYQRILESVRTRIRRWAGHGLSFMGRAYIAKQILMAQFVYHATFIPMPLGIRLQVCTAIYTFVAAGRPADAGAGQLYPARDTCALPITQGGIGLVAIQQQLAALQAKVIGRLMEPEQLPWKGFFDHHLYRSKEWLQTAGAAALVPTQQHIWQLGRHLIFSSLDLGRADLPQRVRSYITSYRRLAPHRIVDPAALPHAAVMAEPLWHSWRICDPITHQPLAWHHWAGLGVIRVGDLRELAAAAPGDLPATVREGLPTIMRALPEAWAAALRSVAPPAQWLVSPDAADRRVWSWAPDGSLGASHVVSPTGALLPAPPGAAGGGAA